MKLLLCTRCGDMRALRTGAMIGFVQVIPRPVTCECGHSWAEWLDPASGIARYGGKDASKVFGIGLHNGLLRRPLSEYEEPEAIDYKLHELANGYLFKQLASMVVIFRPGSSSDTSFDHDWVLDQEEAA